MFTLLQNFYKCKFLQIFSRAEAKDSSELQHAEQSSTRSPGELPTRQCQASAARSQPHVLADHPYLCQILRAEGAGRCAERFRLRAAVMHINDE